MEELAKRKDLIITNVGKVGAVVIMDTNSYIKEASQQLSDKATHKQLTLDPTLQHNNGHQKFLDSLITITTPGKTNSFIYKKNIPSYIRPLLVESSIIFIF